MLHRALVDRYTAYATVITTWPLRKLFWPYIYIGRAFYTVLYYIIHWKMQIQKYPVGGVKRI